MCFSMAITATALSGIHVTKLHNVKSFTIYLSLLWICSFKLQILIAWIRASADKMKQTIKSDCWWYICLYDIIFSLNKVFNGFMFM